ncbi:pre T-cell antigen receptor alpha [Dipodomys merriami]|uniref:pre T-cell antigen receptor alpha n=1 Tax=Dipodomys merriami TaxID=94247 RepID=UPI003855F1A3
MARQPWLLLLLPLGCPALPTGLGVSPFPSLAPPIALQVNGEQRTLVICLVLDAAPAGLDSAVWFSAGNGSVLDAFTYGPSPAADGTWSSLAQLSVSSEKLAVWEPLVCHTRPAPGGQSLRTQPLKLSGAASPARPCVYNTLRGEYVEHPGKKRLGIESWTCRLRSTGESPRKDDDAPRGRSGTRSQALCLGALRLLFCKLLLTDVLLTCHILLLPRPHSRPSRPLISPGHSNGETQHPELPQAHTDLQGWTLPCGSRGQEPG